MKEETVTSPVSRRREKAVEASAITVRCKGAMQSLLFFESVFETKSHRVFVCEFWSSLFVDSPPIFRGETCATLFSV